MQPDFISHFEREKNTKELLDDSKSYNRCQNLYRGNQRIVCVYLPGHIDGCKFLNKDTGEMFTAPSKALKTNAWRDPKPQNSGDAA